MFLKSCLIVKKYMYLWIHGILLMPLINESLSKGYYLIRDVNLIEE